MKKHTKILLLLAIMALLGLATFAIAFAQSGPQVIISSPIPNQKFTPGELVSVVVTAVDAQGVARLDLAVNGQVIARHANPNPAPNQPFLVDFRWEPNTYGTQIIQVFAYNTANYVGQSDQVLVQIVTSSGQPGPEPGPIPTATPNFPYVKVTGAQSLKVRSGPSTRYPQIGALAYGQTAQVTGRNDIGEGNWWQIVFLAGPAGHGWISGNPAYATSYNTGNVYVVAAPPIPLPPTPTPAPTPSGPIHQFSVDRTRIHAGECVNFHWHVTGVRAVYFNGQGVGGENQSQQECPTSDTTYTLRVEETNGNVLYRDIRIYVDGSGGGGTGNRSDTMRENDGIDFDNDGKDTGSGNDFLWYWTGSKQRFERWDQFNPNIILAKVYDRGSEGDLNGISLDTCTARLGQEQRSEITLKETLIICFRTNEGRIGKMRVRDMDNREIRVQWYVWR